MRFTRPGADAAARGAAPNAAPNRAIAGCGIGLTRVGGNATVCQPVSPSPLSSPETTRMRRFALLLFAGIPSLALAQGFGVYEHNTCAMARAGVTAASPCADGSAIFFSPAGLAGLSGTHFSAGVTLIGAQGNFTDDFLAQKTDLNNPVIPVPSGYFAHALSPKLTVGIGVFAPYGLETKWPTDFEGRFVGYNTDIRSIYIQ